MAVVQSQWYKDKNLSLWQLVPKHNPLVGSHLVDLWGSDLYIPKESEPTRVSSDEVS